MGDNLMEDSQIAAHSPEAEMVEVSA